MVDAPSRIIDFFVNDFKDWLAHFRWWFEYATYFYVGIHGHRIVLLFPDFHWFRAISFPFFSIDDSVAYYCYRWLPFKLLRDAEPQKSKELFFPASRVLIEKLVDFISEIPVAEVDYPALKIFFSRIKSNAGRCSDLKLWDKDEVLFDLRKDKLVAYFLSKKNTIHSASLDLKSSRCCQFYLNTRLIKLGLLRLLDLRPLVFDKKKRQLRKLSLIFAENFLILSLPPAYIGFDIGFRRPTPVAFSRRTNSPFLLPIDYH